ncbi:MAG: hypothetical protein J7M18_08875 [Candidatus Eremiobacteraeota bacterium]|nr:hypothetical protein [Candidatus Eremiobacteraeota bacterium]
MKKRIWITLVLIIVLSAALFWNIYQFRTNRPLNLKIGDPESRAIEQLNRPDHVFEDNHDLFEYSIEGKYVFTRGPRIKGFVGRKGYGTVLSPGPDGEILRSPLPDTGKHALWYDRDNHIILIMVDYNGIISDILRGYREM